MSQDKSANENVIPTDTKPYILPSTVEWDLFRASVESVNQTLRLQITLAAGLMAGCITIFNVLPPQIQHSFLNTIDNYVFIPVFISIAFAYHGLNDHWKYESKKSPPPDEVQELTKLLSHKYKMLHSSSVLLSISAVLLAVFVLIEFP